MIKQDGRKDKFMSLPCPARKPLIEVVRPILHRNLNQTSVTHGDHVLVKLLITGAPHDISWSSQARRFEVNFVFISLNVAIIAGKRRLPQA